MEERNGAYELEMQYPVSGVHYTEIEIRCIVLAIPSPYRLPQPFRIYRITRPLNGAVTIYAQHISYDLSLYRFQRRRNDGKTAKPSGGIQPLPLLH